MLLGDPYSAPTQILVGGGLIATPWWASTLETVNYVGTTIAVICGAIVGVHGVWMIWKNRKK